MRDRAWLRGVITLAILGALAGAMIASPVGAAFNPTKKQIKKIARKQAAAVFDASIGPAIDGKQQACANGSVLAYALVDGHSLDGTFSSDNVDPQFNCAGAPIDARVVVDPGVYEVRIPGITTPSLSDRIVAQVSDADDNTNFVSYESSPGTDFIEVSIWTFEGNPIDDEFSIAVYNDP
ncbi:MAG: hypothetical protein M3135_08085 [Actinomycetota bacterium]|nr:hypothetical protein [Actinomycetota bacterium]